MKIQPNGVDTPPTDKSTGAVGAARPRSHGSKTEAAGTAAPTPAVQGNEFSSRIQALRDKVAAGDVVDHAKVASVSAAIAAGTFKVDADAVADKLLQGATELVAKPK